MEQGMLWFDNSKRTLVMKVQDAAAHYKKKYGCIPDLCLVHPGAVSEGTPVSVMHYGKEIHIRPYRSVLPNHLWLGMDEQPEYVQPTVEANARQERERAVREVV